MKRTVADVAKAAGISVRTLHHYDDIGVLKPQVAANGYRIYGDSDLLRLQRILAYRELGMALGDIAPLLDAPGEDAHRALVTLRDRVAADLQRRSAMLATLDRTIAALETGDSMQDDALFLGISPERQAAYEAEIATRYGDGARETVAASRSRLEALGPAGRSALKSEIDAIHAAFVGLIARGVQPDEPEAQALTARHHAWVCRSWTPDAHAYAGLGTLYVEHGDFRAMYDALDPALAPFLQAAMARFATHALS